MTKRVCWDCGEYTFIYMYGINGLCLSCLQRRGNNNHQDHDPKSKSQIQKKIDVIISGLNYYEQEQRRVNSPNDGRMLTTAIRTDVALIHDRIDRCDRRQFYRHN